MNCLTGVSGARSHLAAAFPVERLAREHGSPIEKRCPDAESGRAAWIVDEVADQSLDARACKSEDHSLIREKDAMPAKAGQAEPVWSAPREDLRGSVVRAWDQPGDDRDTLIGVSFVSVGGSPRPTDQL